MKRILVYLLLLVSFIDTKAQIITGKVYRAGTDTVIAGASVYYGGSMVGTATDKDGHFELYAQAQQIPVVVSCIGYYSATANYKPSQPLIVYLKPKTTQLRAVTIRVDGMNRKQEIALFTKEFIGTSTFAKSCTITNIDDIDLFYSKKTKTLTASCDKPIIIENKKLGYTISYFLDSFLATATHVSFVGNYIFKENIPVKANLAEIKQNREDAYKFSRMQFIRALWHHQLSKAGFRIFTPDLHELTEGKILVTDSLNQQYIHLDKKIYIVSDLLEFSGLTAKDKFSFIDKNGFYSQALQWSASLTVQRVGDLLPFEYKSESDPPDTIPAKIVNTPTPALAASAKKTSTLPFEKAYMHTDKDVYTLGDTLWFKAYLVNGQDNMPALSSGNLYVELLTPDSTRILTSEIIRMENGLGNGDMALADSLPAGTYRLRAYTNWMRNFGDNFVFEKNITVLNNLAFPTVPDPKTLTAKKNTKAPKVTSTATSVPVTSISILPIVRFYPEGGSLVNGITAFIGVKAEDGYGKGTSAKGTIISSAGDTVTHFTCDSLGMGLLVMLPVAGQSYHAMVELADGRHDVFQLPSALSEGLTLQIRQTDSVIHAIVSTNDTTVKAALLIVKHAGITFLSKQLQINDRQLVARIPAASLPEGISAITIYNSSGRPECERLVYIHHTNNIFKSEVHITANKKNYQPKEQVSVNIQTQPNSNLSMAVVDAGIVPVQNEDIVSYINLQSELRGDIENPTRYFDTTNVNRFKQLNQLLLTQGWRDFVWRRMADTAIRISYAAENGIKVSGRIRDENLNKMLHGLNISLHTDSTKGTKLFFTSSDSAGRYQFNGLMLYGQQHVVISAVDNKGKSKGAFWLDTIPPMPIKPITVQYHHIPLTTDAATAVVENRITDMKNANIKGVTRLKEIQVKAKKNIITRYGDMLTTFGYPDQIFSITPNDYQYKTLEWYMLQKAKGARQGLQVGITGVVFPGVDTAGSVSIPGITGTISSARSRSRLVPPSLIVNGQELNMLQPEQAEGYRIQYFNMPLNKFKKIQIRHMVGTLHGPRADGTAMPSGSETVLVDRYLLYLTMQDNYMVDNPGSIDAVVQGYYQARTFYEPPPNAKPSADDYRTTIHWEPNIKTDAMGKATVNFNNAVPSTDVRVIVEGITGSGTSLSNTSYYKVE